MAGIDLARLADLPPDVLVEGRRVAEYLEALQTSHEESSESSKIAIRRRALLRVLSFSFSSFVSASTGFSFLWALLPCRLGVILESDFSFVI